MRPLIARISVLLPHPDGPATRRTSPASIVSDRPSIAGLEPRRYWKVSPSISTMCSAAPAGGDAGRCSGTATASATTGSTLARSGAPDPDLLVDGCSEASRRVGLVVGVAEPARGVLVEHGRHRHGIAERPDPRDLF